MNVNYLTVKNNQAIYDLENLFKNDFALSIAKTCENEFDYRKFNTISGDGTVAIYNYNLSSEFAHEIGLSNSKTMGVVLLPFKIPDVISVHF